MIFKNVGAAAGASLEHTHSQLIVTPIVPINVVEEIDRLAGVLSISRPLRVLRHDRAGAGVREADRARLARLRGLLPVCRRFPFETWILPKAHASHYENIQKNGVEELARVMKQVIEQDRSGARPAGLQLHHPHGPV